MKEINPALTGSMLISLTQATIIIECELCDTLQTIVSNHGDGVFICRACREEIARDDFHSDLPGSN